MAGARSRLERGSANPPSPTDTGGRPPPPSGPRTGAQVGPTELVVRTIVERKALIGAGTKVESPQSLAVPVEGEITALRLDGRGEDLFVGTSRGQVVRYDMRDTANPTRADVTDVTGNHGAVTALGLLIGDRTLVVGDQAGGGSTGRGGFLPPG